MYTQHIRFLIEVNTPELLGNGEREALQEIVTYIIQEDLPVLDTIGQFVFALNWNLKTLSIGMAAAQEMFDEETKHLCQKPELIPATEKSKLHQTIESFIRSISGNPYYEVSEESQLIDDLHQIGESMKKQINLWVVDQAKRSQEKDNE